MFPPCGMKISNPHGWTVAGSKTICHKLGKTRFRVDKPRPRVCRGLDGFCATSGASWGKNTDEGVRASMGLAVLRDFKCKESFEENSAKAAKPPRQAR